MSELIIGRRGLEALRTSLSDSDLAITASVDRFRFLSAKQIEALHFAGRSSSINGARACRRALERLTRVRVLTRLDRRIGGVRAGSASFIYGLGPIGDRLLGVDGPRRRWREPSLTFLNHTLAIADLVVELETTARQGHLELISYETEPMAWRRFSRGLAGDDTLKPDLFVAVGSGDYEDRWFIEIDLATESTTTVLRKCQTYQRYFRAGVEHARHGVFPKVLWIVPTEKRSQQLRSVIADSGGLMNDLFEVVMTGAATERLARNDP